MGAPKGKPHRKFTQAEKLEADVARLKKGYRVKGSGSQKEFVTGSGKSFRSSKI